MRPSRHDAPVAVVLGRRGSGKTTLVKSFLPRFHRVIVVDPNHEYSGEVFTSLGDLYRACLGGGSFQVVYQPPTGAPDADELDRVDCVAQVAWTVRSVLLVIDEADRYVRLGKDTLPYVRLVIDQGRHRNVGLCAIARRPSRVPKDVIENASSLYLFHCHEPHSQRYLAGIIGADVEALAGLSAGQYLAWSERGGVVHSSIALPTSKKTSKKLIAASIAT